MENYDHQSHVLYSSMQTTSMLQGEDQEVSRARCVHGGYKIGGFGIHQPSAPSFLLSHPAVLAFQRHLPFVLLPCGAPPLPSAGELSPQLQTHHRCAAVASVATSRRRHSLQAFGSLPSVGDRRVAEIKHTL